MLARTGSCAVYSSGTMRKLHIGGTIRAAGWEIMDALPGPHVDHLGNAKDLSRFADGSFDEIYASHVAEHFDYRDELLAAFTEWHRTLAPLGLLYVSVPDLDVLAGLFAARDRLTPEERFHVMRMIFGGHTDAHDYHSVGLNGEFLRSYLVAAGFKEMKKVDEFGIFNDSSSLRFKGSLISLNVIARKGP